MNRTGSIPLALSFLALVACADKPANTASSAETTSARYPDSTMSSNVNDTSATGAATNESPNARVQNAPTTRTTSANLVNAPKSTTGTSTTPAPRTWGTSNPTPSSARTDTAVPAHDVNRSADAASTNGTYDNSAGAPGAIAPPPPAPQNNSPKTTPIDQGNGSSDLKITQAIRKEVIGNGDLSFTAKNVKIITKGGHVTLKGQVKTPQERDEIEGTAIRVAGAQNVDDQIVVKP